MGLKIEPVAKIARRIIKQHSLIIPFNLYTLVLQYADIEEIPIPIDGVDGVCLNLKSSTKKPRIILNSYVYGVRKKFTLAHELGHIVIPWHYGTILDKVDEPIKNYNSPYWKIEREANLFASELLMPFDWIHTLYKVNRSYDFLLDTIMNQCNVSEIAAKIRLGKAIPEIEQIILPNELVQEIYLQNIDLAITQKLLIEISKFTALRVAQIMCRDLNCSIAFCVENDNIVIGSGGSSKSYPYYQFPGEKFFKNPYNLYKTYSKYVNNKSKTHWWFFQDVEKINSDGRSWREIINTIANEIRPSTAIKFKQSVNGIISGMHGHRSKKLTINQFENELIMRFDIPDFSDFTSHQDFYVFIKTRCDELYR